ncbi:methylated-DNA--[protein]-cysteine S-methyltransferase [Paenibacillus contaminans]|uniref:methylated-DNA--[protein]-cysteine S-methyltransferase n=1 Tax=Paenibacillus contaminans TaxID=450362 RepID=A0A329MSL1_9BACL|nr:methylated-DNA--[protein]-cysteine S-methyltransferase [Paenibacillus contaminans]RAV22969.1 cysteine methyltransferase [Paenibacillus contaminans]
MGNKPQRNIYWSLLELEAWSMHIAAVDEGLCFVGSQNKSYEELAEWATSRLPGSTLIRDDEKLRSYAAELVEYLQGERESFTFPFSLHGTPFQEAVWDALCAIPYGQTKSYSDIANHIKKPAAVRAVGAAIGANPVLISVPCHRVIGKNGALTGYRGGMDMKTKLLQLERTGLPADGAKRHG